MSKQTAALTVIAAALTVLCAACGSGPPPPPQRVLSGYETATGRVIARDCGFSVPLAGKAGGSLWLFCDTVVTSRQGKEIGFPILGAGTAAVGPGTAGRGPGTLTEVATPTVEGPGGVAGASAGAAGGLLPARAGPQPFLPVPPDLTLPASTLPCAGPHAYPARWVTGAAREPGSSGHVLISYADYCVSGSDTFSLESFGLIDYDPAGNVLGTPVQVFRAPAGQSLPQPQALGSPVFLGGSLYLFGWCGPGCGHGGVFLARTRATAGWWDDGFTYQYWTGRGWSADLASAATLTGLGPLQVSAGDYSAAGHGLAMIVQTSAAGDFSVWQADAPAGPWREIRTGRVPCTAGIHAGDLCRALIGHPELSDQGELMISFFNPGADHVEVLAYPW